MDQAPLQQTMMETSIASFPQEASPPPNEEGAPNTTTTEPMEGVSYDELFPALPNADTPQPSSSDWTPSSDWSNSDMKIASSVITQVFRVPFEELKQLDSNQFNECRRIIADISSKTNAHIEISSAKDQSLTFLVNGKPSEVAKAKVKILEKFQTQASQMLRIPKEHHKIILGKKGKRLAELEAVTSAKISVPKPNSASEEIIVRGTREAIEKAVHEINLTSDEQSKQAYEKLDIPKIYHPFIQGGNNNKINALMKEHGVRINVPPPSISKDEITIAGEKEAVMKCKEWMLTVYKEMEKKCQTVSVEVTKPQHKYVVGHRGANIAEILNETNVSVEMPHSDSSFDTITLRGPQDKLGQALTAVYAKANSIVISNIEAPTWLHKYIIGRKGANIKQITQDLPTVHVEFETEKGGIKLEGPPEEVEFARAVLEADIADKRTRLTFDEITVDPRFYKHIIGKSGSNINRIRSETEVNINISQVDDNNIIRLEGSPTGVAQAKKELIDLVSKMENEKEREIIIEQRFHRNIIGSKGENIKEIREKFNQVQISFSSPGAKSDVVKIRGPKDDVDRCYKHLHKLAQELMESNNQIKVNVFRHFHKFVIGKGGSTINKIREETNTRIDLPSEGQNSDIIIITGKKEDCEKAKKRIQKIQSEMANIVEVDIIIPCKFHNSMIGAGGKLIQSISEDCGGVAIKFPPPESKSDKVTIRGPKEDVQKAKLLLVEQSNEKQLASFSAEVYANPKMHRFLIGKNGSNIRKIRDKTGARIIFPNENDSNKEQITILGKKESVANAKQELESIIRDLDKIVEDTINVDPKHHRHFIARRGEVLRNIADQFGGVTISFPRQGVYSDKVTLKGSKDCVDAAKVKISEIVTELEQIASIHAVIPQKHHRTVMGQRGIKVQNISAEFDVHIKFPDKDSGMHEDAIANGTAEMANMHDIVIIQGKKEKCEGAKEALLALVPITVKVSVVFKHHRFIIGQKGEFVRRIMSDHEVNVQVPPAHEECDHIMITGPPANVEKAKEMVLLKVQELEEEEADRLARSFSLTLNVDPEYHPKIIGRKGAVITKIRQNYDVNIQFPARGSEDEDVITITGYKENCQKAKQAILDITGDLENMIRKHIDIDSRIHSRLIGAKGRAIRKVMEDYKVEIKFPREEDTPDQVLVLGLPEAVDDCCEHLLNLAEEYLQDLTDREEVSRYVRGEHNMFNNDDNTQVNSDNDQGFVVPGAPWMQSTPNMDSSEDFPSMGTAMGPSSAPVWGPRR